MSKHFGAGSFQGAEKFDTLAFLRENSAKVGAIPMKAQRHHDAGSDQMAAQNANLQARNIVLARSINMWNSIFTQTLQGVPQGQTINVPVRNVGLIKRFVVEITYNVVENNTVTLTRTPWGPANTLSQIVFTDLANQTRINDAGWHMHLLATARRQAAFGAAFVNDSPINIGSNYPVIVAPSAINNQTSQVRMFYEVPISYGDMDLRGGIYAGVVNATMNLQLVVNPQMIVASTASKTLAVYQSSGAATAPVVSNFTINVYQNYLDQLPFTANGPILPALDMSTAYLLNNTAKPGLSANQDNPFPYANFRNFMSTSVIFDQGGTLNAGTDVNAWKLESANYTNIFNIDPYMASLLTREIIGDDFPAGTYYFDHRQKPISTIQYGNMQLILNPSVVSSASSQALLGYEALALINQVTQAGSLYGNN